MIQDSPARLGDLFNSLLEKFSARDGRKWSQADLVEAAISALAKAERVKGGA
jgi:hypothetical protein